MDHEFFTVRLHAAGMAAINRIPLETRFVDELERELGGANLALSACQAAAADAGEATAFLEACRRAETAMRSKGMLPQDARFSVQLLKVVDL